MTIDAAVKFINLGASFDVYLRKDQFLKIVMVRKSHMGVRIIFEDGDSIDSLSDGKPTKSIFNETMALIEETLKDLYTVNIPEK